MRTFFFAVAVAAFGASSCSREDRHAPASADDDPQLTPGAESGGAGGGAGDSVGLGGSSSGFYASTGGSPALSEDWASFSAGAGGGSGGGGGAGGGSPSAGTDAGAPPVDGRTNPFVVTAHDPLSTFAVDVDTASYDIFRREVGYGYLPAPEMVRVEDFVNYFDYAYPAPAPDSVTPFSVKLAAAPHVAGAGTTLLRIGLQGREPPPFVKKPANLVYLVDVSGSMQDPLKLPLVQFVLTRSLDVLAPEDTISIVTYAGSTEVRLPPTPVANRSVIEQEITELAAGGSTNGAGGIQLAYEQAEAGFIQDGINHVILCTDGDFNIGISDTASLVALIEEKRRSGVTLTALGFGQGNNDAMMEAVSNAGNGMYSVITSEDQASRYVEERLLATIVHIAQDVKIQVELNPSHVYAYRLIGYENRAIADVDFRNDVIDAGEIGAGHRVTAIYELALTPEAVPIPAGAPSLDDGAAFTGVREVLDGEFVMVKVRYKEPGALETDPAKEIREALAPDAIATGVTLPDPSLEWAAAIAAFAEILKGSPYASSAHLESIGAIVQAQGALDADRAEFADLFTAARPLIAP